MADSLDEELSKLFDEVIAEDDYVDDEGVDAAAPSAAERARDERGRFAPKDTAAAPAEAAEQQDTDQGNVEAPPAEQASPAAVPAPQSWSAAAQAEWGKLSPTLQAEVSKRENDVAKGFQQYAQALRFFEPAARELETIRDALVAHGTDPSTYLGMLVASAKAMDSDPSGFIKSLASIYNIDLATLAGGQAQQQTIDPTIASLQQRLDAVQTHLQRETQRQQEATKAQLRSDIDRFKADPQNKHFDLVRNDMAVLLNSGAAADLKDAYNKACRLNDQVVKLEWEAYERSQAEERAKKANGARKAKEATVAGSAGFSPPVKKSFEDTLVQRYDELFGG